MNCLYDGDGRYGGDGNIALKISNMLGANPKRPRKWHFRECFPNLRGMVRPGIGLWLFGSFGVEYLE